MNEKTRKHALMPVVHHIMRYSFYTLFSVLLWQLLTCSNDDSLSIYNLFLSVIIILLFSYYYHGHPSINR